MLPKASIILQNSAAGGSLGTAKSIFLAPPKQTFQYGYDLLKTKGTKPTGSGW